MPADATRARRDLTGQTCRASGYEAEPEQAEAKKTGVKAALLGQGFSPLGSFSTFTQTCVCLFLLSELRLKHKNAPSTISICEPTHNIIITAWNRQQ